MYTPYVVTWVSFHQVPIPCYEIYIYICMPCVVMGWISHQVYSVRSRMFMPCVVTEDEFYRVSSELDWWQNISIRCVYGNYDSEFYRVSSELGIGDRIFLNAVYTVVTTVSFTESSLQLIAEHELIGRLLSWGMNFHQVMNLWYIMNCVESRRVRWL